MIPALNLLLLTACWSAGVGSIPASYTLHPTERRPHTAASPFLYRPEVYRVVAGLVGAERVLFGSDHPLLTQKRALDDAAAAGMSDDDLSLVLGGNAYRLLGLPDSR